MIVPDVNLLLYAVNRDLPQHESARNWLEGILSGSDVVGLPWLVSIAFLRISTNRRILPSPLEPEAALGIVESWLAQPFVRPLNPGERHWHFLRRLLGAAGTAGNLTNDAHLAAIAIERNAELHSADNDFRRFPGLKYVNPIPGTLNEPRGSYGLAW